MKETTNTSLSNSINTEKVTMKNGKMLEIAIPSGITGKELAQKTIAEPRWLIEGKIPVGTTALAASPKSGKTIWAFQLAYAAATGGIFLGCPVTKGTVIYCDLESTQRRSKKRFAKMGLDISQLDNLIIVNSGIKTITDGLEQQLMAYRKKYEDLNLVVIDTLSKVYPGITKDYSEETKIYSSLRRISTSLGITVLLVHHKSKYKNDADPFSGAYGTNALAGNCDVLISLSTKNKGDREVELFMEGNDIETCRQVCLFEDLHWSVLGDSWEIAEKKMRDGIYKHPIYKAIEKGISMHKSEGVYSFTASSLTHDAKYWRIPGMFIPAKTLAKWIRDNKPVLEDMLEIIISERRTAGGTEFSAVLLSPE